ncbi:MAG: YraN family protein [Candidatus Aquicultor sp.]
MALGQSGEDFAVRYLRRKNYRILQRNFRTKIGEIDIIASTGKTLIFCEVKTRLSKAYGHPIEAVTPSKQRTIRKVAEVYLAMAKDVSRFDSIRFDVISILSEGASLEVTHWENAF